MWSLAVVLQFVGLASALINGTTITSSTSYTNNASFPLSLSGAVWYHDQQCQYLTPGNIPNPYTNATIAPALASQCETQWSSSFSAFAATESITGEIGPYTCTFPDGGYETDMYGVTWDPTATSPCCLSCTLSGGTARVLYWPTPAPNSAVSTLVDLDTNFTFVSPSVYIAFNSIGATDYCGQIGQPYYNTTLSFGQFELSTSIDGTTLTAFNGLDQAPSPTSYDWTAFNYADLGGNCSEVTISYFVFSDGSTEYASTLSTGPYGAFPTGDPRDYLPIEYYYNPCSPTLSVPTQIRSLNAAWATCVQGIYAFYDPPIALRPVSDLVVPNTITHGPFDPGTVTAVTGPTITPPTATPTLTVGASGKSSVFDPPSSISLQSPVPEIVSSTPSKSDTFPASISGSNRVSSQESIAKSMNYPETSTTLDPEATQTIGSSAALTSIITFGASGTGTESSTVVLPVIASVPFSTLASVGDQQIQGASNGGIIVAGTTFAPGSQINVAGTSLSNDGGNAVVGGSTVVIASASTILPLPVVTVAGNPITPTLSSSALILAGQTLVNGGPAATISGIPVSLGSAGLVVGGNSISLTPTVLSYPQPVITIAGQAFTVASSGSVLVLAGETLTMGGPAALVSGTSVSFGSAGLIIGSSTVPSVKFSSSTPYPIFTLAGQLLTATPLGSELVIAGQTLSIGGPVATVSGTPVSLASAGLIIGTSTIPLAPTEQLGFTIASQAYTATPSGSVVILAGQTLSISGPAATISGTPVSLASAGLIIGTSTLPLTPAEQPIFTIASQGYTATPSGFVVVVAGQTLSIGGPAVIIAGTPISLGPSGLIIGTSTLSLAHSAPTILINGHPVTANLASEYVIDGQTLMPGAPAITVSGTPISLAPSGTNVVIGGSTEAVGVGGLIMSGIGGSATPTAGGSATAVFTGAAVRTRADGWGAVGVAVAGMGFGVWGAPGL